METVSSLGQNCVRKRRVEFAKGGGPAGRCATSREHQPGLADANLAIWMTVSNENIEGWMAPMPMMDKADRDDVHIKVKSGDQITARVYDGIEDMLYDVRVIPSGAGGPQ